MFDGLLNTLSISSVEDNQILLAGNGRFFRKNILILRQFLNILGRGV